MGERPPPGFSKCRKGGSDRAWVAHRRVSKEAPRSVAPLDLELSAEATACQPVDTRVLPPGSVLASKKGGAEAPPFHVAQMVEPLWLDLELLSRQQAEVAGG